MKKSENIYIETISTALTQYSIKNNLSFSLYDEPLTLEETFNEIGALILFLSRGKQIYEFIYKQEFIRTIFEYNSSKSFPLSLKKGVSYFEWIPVIDSSNNFDNVLIFSLHALIDLHKKHRRKENFQNLRVTLDELTPSLLEMMKSS